jgi:hypothetical protein
MANQRDEYKHLLSDATGRYVLIQVVPGSKDVETCVVYDTATKTGLVIEDDEEALLVKKQLADRGIPMLDNLPTE